MDFIFSKNNDITGLLNDIIIGQYFPPELVTWLIWFAHKVYFIVIDWNKIISKFNR